MEHAMATAIDTPTRTVEAPLTSTQSARPVTIPTAANFSAPATHAVSSSLANVGEPVASPVPVTEAV
ncbi:MAG TPA: hypothetical protein VFG04_01080, partial [Planctomycetaceae bacterium]|nr:hypothetical protein [Planctomycetaceae bacterium]